MGDAGSTGTDAQATADNFYNGLKTSTSVDGAVLPVIFGTTRVAGNVIWAGAFSQQAASVGKGGGGKAAGQYTYSASFMLGLCEGQITGIGQVWLNKQTFTTAALAGITVKNGSYPQTPWSYLTASFPAQALPYSGVAYVCVANYPLGSSSTMPSFNFEAQGLNIIGGSAQTVTDLNFVPGSAPYSLNAANITTWISDGGVTYTTGGNAPQWICSLAVWNAAAVAYTTAYKAAINAGGSQYTTAVGAGEKAAQNYLNAHATYYANGAPAGTTLTYCATLPADIGLTLIGTGGFQASGFYTYSNGIYSFCDGDANVGVSITYTYTIQDAHPADIVTGIITNSKYGLVPSFPLNTPDFTAGQNGWRDWCTANGFFLSVSYDNQQSLSTHLTDLLDQTFSTCIWHDANTLQIVPYGDTAVTGNGITWTPNVSPLYDLTDDDFLDNGSDDPVKGTRKTPSQADNDVKIEFMNRANAYNTQVVDAGDQGSQDIYMRRPAGVKTMHGICQASMAARLAQLTLQRSVYIRNTYEITLSGIKYGHLEPMDIVTLTDSALGMNKYTVRITQIEEDENWDLTATIEDFPQGVGHTVIYPTQGKGAYSRNDNASPGNINTPLIFTAPGALTQNGYEIWAAISGGANWGGCDVYVSTDNTTYKLQQRIYGAARYGTIMNVLPVAADPDVTDTLAVDMSSSGAQLLSGTQADADNDVTICMVDNELLSYETATLITTNQYGLTYLRRGQHFSKQASHAIGATFIRLDGQIAKYPFTPSMTGQTLYFKFLSFNLAGGAEQQLADVSPYTYTITGSVTNPPNVTGFFVTQSGTLVVTSWNVLNNSTVVGYEIRYGVVGGTWATATTITTVEAGTHLVSAKVPPGAWTFYIAAIDKSANYSVTPSSYNYTVINPNQAATSIIDQALLGWPGTKTNLIQSVDGNLVPMSNGAYTNNDWLWCTSFCINPFSSYSYLAPEISLSANQTLRAFATINETLAPSGGNWIGGGTGTPAPVVELNYQPNGGSWTGYQTWTLGTITLQNALFEFIMTPAQGIGSISSFIPQLDMPLNNQSGANVGVVSGGTTITFAQSYNQQPTISITLLSSGSYTLTQTTTGFTISGYTGYINWSAIGV